MEKGQSRFVVAVLLCVAKLLTTKYTEENAHNSNSRQSSSSSSISQSENAVFGMPLEVAVALTKIDADDLIPAVFKRCIEYLDHVGMGGWFAYQFYSC